MTKNTALRTLLFAVTCALFCWWLFAVGYYVAFAQAEKEKIRLASGDIKLMKHLNEELQKGNSAEVADKLRYTAEFKESYIRTLHQALNELTLMRLAFDPMTTINLLLSRNRSLMYMEEIYGENQPGRAE